MKKKKIFMAQTKNCQLQFHVSKLGIWIFTTIIRLQYKLTNILFLHKWINKLFSGRVAGSATYKQSKTVWTCVFL